MRPKKVLLILTNSLENYNSVLMFLFLQNQFLLYGFSPDFYDTCKTDHLFSRTTRVSESEGTFQDHLVLPNSPLSHKLRKD